MVFCSIIGSRQIAQVRIRNNQVPYNLFQKFTASSARIPSRTNSALWELLKNYEDMEDPLFVKWIKTNAYTSFELNFAIESRELKSKRRPSLLGTDYPIVWDYYESLVKLSNNRLGIFNKNEGYLFFTMAESLKAVASTTTHYASAGYI